MRRLGMIIGLATLLLANCARLEEVGKVPSFTPIHDSQEAQAMSLPARIAVPLGANLDRASLWSRGDGSLFGDRRASMRGDILTVVIEINDSAEFSNRSARSRNGSESMAVPNLLGIGSIVDRVLPGDGSLATGVSATANSSASGDGSVRRNEKLTLRVAATVVEELQNGILRIQGSQEVRVNFEIRELLVSGFVRPGDISRKNEITYDKIASARVSYGGRGHISDVQQPRAGQQIADIVLPF